MSLRLMKERVKISGYTPREEMIRDGQNLLKEELKHDSSYSPTMYFYDSAHKIDDRPANMRIYNRKHSSLNGNYMNFLTTYDNPIKVGEYIHDTKDDTYWLVCNSFNVNDIQYEGKLIQCNYLLRWQLPSGEIVERFANIVSASKYDMGETGNSTIVLSSNNFTVLIGFCEEGYELEDQRVFIDKRNINPEKVFKITRGDDVLFDAGGQGGIMSFIADKAELDMVKDRPDLKLCDYIDIEDSDNDIPQPSPTLPSITAIISGNQNLKIGFARTYTVTFIDESGYPVNVENWDWNIDVDFVEIISESDQKIELFIDDEDYADSSFILSVVKDTVTLAQIEITIIASI